MNRGYESPIGLLDTQSTSCLHIELDNISAWIVQSQGFQEGRRWKKRQKTLGTTRRLTLDVSCGFTPRQASPHYSLGLTLGALSITWKMFLEAKFGWNCWFQEMIEILVNCCLECRKLWLHSLAGPGQQSSPKLTKAPLVKMWPPSSQSCLAVRFWGSK